MIDMAEKSETVNINVQLAERLYPLKVLKSDEEKVHSAVKLVNERIKEYQTLYDGKDKQDYMAMCLLNFAVEHQNLQHVSKDDSRLLEEKMIELEKILSGQL
jgi:cell division protein ZapA